MSPLLQVFFSPAEAYDRIRRKDVLLPALIVILLVVGATTYVQAPVLARDQVRMIRESPELAERVPAVDLEELSRMSVGKKVLTAVMQPVTLVIGLVIYSLLLLVIGRPSGCEMTYRAALSMVLLSAMIHPVLSAVVRTPLVLARGTAIGVSMSPSLFLPNLDPTSVTNQILERFDIFLLWSLAVLIIGISVVSGASRRRAATVGILLWLVSGILVILMFTVSMKLSGMS